MLITTSITPKSFIQTGKINFSDLLHRIVTIVNSNKLYLIKLLEEQIPNMKCNHFISFKNNLKIYYFGGAHHSTGVEIREQIFGVNYFHLYLDTMSWVDIGTLCHLVQFFHVICTVWAFRSFTCNFVIACLIDI